MTAPAGEDPLIALLRAGLDGPGRFGLAVSGGGDSMALMHLAALAGLACEVATVNHGLRAEAAAEARMVAGAAAALGFPHVTLAWDGSAAKGNIQDAARQARRRLLADWAGARGLSAVVLAHTEDDVAETFLMRLSRGAGVDGLSAMAPRFVAGGMVFLRPMLTVPRAVLRAFLTARALPWVEDPTNENLAYDRARARAALRALAPLGLTAARLAEVAGHLSDARAALEAVTEALLAETAREEGGGLALRLDPARLWTAPVEVQRRALLAVIDWFAPAPYPPRGAQVQGLLSRLQAGQPGQLQGVRFFFRKGDLWACPEPRAAMARWQIDGPGAPALTLRALGAEGLPRCPLWRDTGLPREALLSAPSLWDGDRLVAAPHALHPAGYVARRTDPRPLVPAPTDIALNTGDGCLH